MHDTPRPGERKQRSAMVTLTYREVEGWHARHVSQLLKSAREWARRRGFALRYVWVAELQKRGAVHYHLLVWLPRGITMPKPDKQGWWPHGSTRVEWARKPVGYMVKYASKFDGSCAFPPGLRTHGAGGFDAPGRDIRHWLTLPGWLAQQVGVGERVRPLRGGGRYLGSSGEVIASPWRIWFGGGVVQVREVWRYADPIGATGPYSRLVASEFGRSEVVH